MKSPQYIIKGEEIEVLTKTSTGFWIDSKGTFWALREESESVDERDVCGVGFFSLPETEAFEDINHICAGHDYRFSCPIYMAYHTIDEANLELKRQLEEAGHSILAFIFYPLTKIFGRFFWTARSS